MNIIKQNTPTNWARIRPLTHELEQCFGPSWVARWFDDDSRGATTHSVADWSPAVDIVEDDNQYVLRADIPGVDPNDIDITMTDGALTISGTRETQSRNEQDGLKRVERFTGKFFRRFQLPDTADANSIDARSDHGVLIVTIPKQAKAQPRRIKVKS